MKFESHHEVILGKLEPALIEAADEVVERAEIRAPKKTGKYAGSIRRSGVEGIARGLRVRVGSPVSSARVKELGGYMEAKRGPYLKIRTPDGWRTVKAVRVPAQPTVGPAAQEFGEIFFRALARQRVGPGIVAKFDYLRVV